MCFVLFLIVFLYLIIISVKIYSNTLRAVKARWTYCPKSYFPLNLKCRIYHCSLRVSAGSGWQGLYLSNRLVVSNTVFSNCRNEEYLVSHIFATWMIFIYFLILLSSKLHLLVFIFIISSLHTIAFTERFGKILIYSFGHMNYT